MSELDRLEELLGRCQRAEVELKGLIRSTSKKAVGASERIRLEGKAEGMRLAMSYIRDTLNEATMA